MKNDEIIKLEIDRRDIEKLERGLNDLPEAAGRAAQNIASDIRQDWKSLVSGHVDKGWLLNSIDLKAEHRVDAKSFVIDSSSDIRVVYGQIFEEGSKTRNYEGRGKLKRTIEMIDRLNRVEDRVFEEFDRTLKT